MNILLENLRNGLKIGYSGHIQGFPNETDPALRGVYSLICPQIMRERVDPRYKAAAILSLVSVAGGLITITPSSFRCNNGFIDTFGTTYQSDNPVLENLQTMAEEYVDDGYFIEKALDYFEKRYGPKAYDPKAYELIRDYESLIQLSETKTKNADEKAQISILRKITNLLSSSLLRPGKTRVAPQKWDSNAWLAQFLPIWKLNFRALQHTYRARYYRRHIEITEAGRYISQSGKLVDISWDAVAMMDSSRLYSQEMHFAPPEKQFDTDIEIWEMDCLDAAKKVQETNSGITAVLNLANRQNPGGGVFTGSGAQEESCFLRSNYYTAMYPFARYAYQYDLPKSKKQYPLDRNYGGVWSKGITVFRGRELEGYPLLDEPWQTNFIAVAAINNPSTVIESGEKRLTPEMITGTLNKMRTIMNIAADNQVSNLVLGAMGCGAFHNPPKHISELFYQVINEPAYRGRFQKIVFAITDSNLCDVFAKTFG